MPAVDRYVNDIDAVGALARTLRGVDELLLHLPGQGPETIAAMVGAATRNP
jgi:hypothetical protein